MNQNRLLHPILYVDNEKNNLTVFYSTFRRNYKVYLASSGNEGIEIMRNNEIRLVVMTSGRPE
jgi:CheY-like chemotaxis protein